MGLLNETNSNSTSDDFLFKRNATGGPGGKPGVYDLSVEDTNWVITSSFIIFTMQTGKYILIIIISNFC